MKLFNKVFGKKQLPSKNAQVKDFSFADHMSFTNVFGDLSSVNNYQIAKTLAVNYYMNCSPITNSIDMIAEAVSDLTPMLWDLEKEEWIKQHPVLDLLKHTNADIVWSEFATSMISFFLITGDAFMVASGNYMNPPKELYVYPSHAVTVIPGNDGMANTIQTMLYWGSFVYNREEIEKRYRFFNTAKESQIWQMKKFNPIANQVNVYGMSPLNPIYFDINQHISSNRHNWSMLERGATPSGILNLKEAIDHDSFVALEKNMNEKFAGSQNSGRIMLLNGFGDYVGTTMNNKDMDFLNLKKDVVQSIYTRLKIPLAMISSDTMTMDNFKVAPIQFYQRAVLPVANRFFNELTRFLLPMYGLDSNKVVISYDVGEISALEPLRNEQLKVLKDLQVFTINQIRAECGAEPLDGGGAIYGTQGQTPIATDPSDESIMPDYDDMPALENVGGNDDKPKIKPKATRARFAELMRAKVGEDGKPILSDEEINKIADKHGLE